MPAEPSRLERPRGRAATLAFLGATRTVTGSRFLVDTPTARVLVDCGLFQGLKELRLRNRAPFPVEPASIDAVVLTHAHVDHCGYLPGLVRDGFDGPVYCTGGTVALAGVVLPDCGRLQEEEAAYANRMGFSRHVPALPLFTEADAVVALDRLVPVDLDGAYDIADAVSVTLRRAGHILGSASALLTLAGPTPREVLFSGDVGRPDHVVLEPPEPPPGADVVLCESTYGDRVHPGRDQEAELGEAIRRTLERSGTVLIPAFAVDRTEVILHHLRHLQEQGAIPIAPIFLDSPMASAALDLYRQAAAAGSAEVDADLRRRDPFAMPNLHETRSVDESKALNDQPGPLIIVSASGMLTGGRILHHLARRVTDPRTTIVLVGHQAEGTRGRALVDGERVLKLLGRYYGVQAEVVHLPAFSVHADQAELLQWLRQAPRAPEVLYAVHGEPDPSAALVARVRDELGWPAVVPRDGERVLLG
jgi:metallo-beta-lactamase family protein